VRTRFVSRPYLGSLVLVAVVVSSMSAGCARSSSAGGMDAEVVQADGTPVVSDPDAVLLKWGEQTLIGKCMSAAGFEYFVSGWRALSSGSDREDALYGSDDVTQAESQGYGVAADIRASDARTQDDNHRYIQSLAKQEQDRYGAAMFGASDDTIPVNSPVVTGVTTSRSGCLAEMRSALYGDNATWATVSFTVENIDNQVAGQVVKLPQYKSDLAMWQACMGRAGYVFHSPTAARLSAHDQYVHSHLDFSGERRMASSDAKCSRSSGLATDARAAHKKIREQIEGGLSDELRKYREMTDRGVAHTRQMLSAS
jgi:hypothetical protein